MRVFLPIIISCITFWNMLGVCSLQCYICRNWHKSCFGTEKTNKFVTVNVCTNKNPHCISAYVIENGERQGYKNCSATAKEAKRMCKKINIRIKKASEGHCMFCKTNRCNSAPDRPFTVFSIMMFLLLELYIHNTK